MIVRQRVWNSFLQFLLCVFVFAISSRSEVYYRTSGFVDKSPVWVALDFSVPAGEHITAPVGKGKSMAPTFSWSNASVLDTIWVDQPEKLPPDGAYVGYSKNFTVLFSLVPDDIRKRVSCEVFYVVCGEACRPVFEKVDIKHNGLLSNSEIQKAVSLFENNGSTTGFLLVLLMAFVGGIILNCMPCVFPIVSLKVFSLINNNDEKSARWRGISFSVGAIVTFIVMGLVLISLKGAGSSVGWGFYMQSPAIVASLLAVFCLCSLYCFGLYTVPSVGFTVFKNKNAYIQSFANGIFTSIASGTCVGPFIGVALVSATTIYDNMLMSTAVFFSLGLGVALPFLSISCIPWLHRFLPRPGAWMGTAKELLGFVMVLPCFWLMSVLSKQLGFSGTISNAALVTAFSLVVWKFSRLNNLKKQLMIVAVCVIVAVSIYFENGSAEPIAWTDFSFEKFAELRKEKKPVFLNFTAAWCMTCNVNKFVLNSKEVADIFKKHNVCAMRADWTNHSEVVTNALSLFGSNSVPLYVFYKAGSEKPVILPHILKIQDIMDVME